MIPAGTVPVAWYTWQYTLYLTSLPQATPSSGMVWQYTLYLTSPQTLHLTCTKLQPHVDKMTTIYSSTGIPPQAAHMHDYHVGL